MVVMTENEFWGWLERRVCREFQGLQESSLRYLWCDGFLVDEYVLHLAVPSIHGRAWIVDRRQELWQFTLELPPGPIDRAGIDWRALLPTDDVTGWLTVDRTGKRLEVEPGLARADAQR
jgi:hypothetical protein